jgi:sterol desaturase/sphingolipid hydroxylase (fatty acid hydroxylase superfamily)
MMDPAIIVFIVFSSMATVAIVIGLLIFFAKRLEHKQILAAIEKGTPLSNLKPPKSEPAGPAWIKYLTSGIAIFFIGLAFMSAGPGILGMGNAGPWAFVAFILCGVGLAWVLRGLLYRKYEKQSRLSANNNTAEFKNPISASAPEISKQPGE